MMSLALSQEYSVYSLPRSVPVGGIRFLGFKPRSLQGAEIKSRVFHFATEVAVECRRSHEHLEGFPDVECIVYGLPGGRELLVQKQAFACGLEGPVYFAELYDGAASVPYILKVFSSSRGGGRLSCLVESSRSDKYIGGVYSFLLNLHILAMAMPFLGAPSGGCLRELTRQELSGKFRLVLISDAVAAFERFHRTQKMGHWDAHAGNIVHRISPETHEVESSLIDYSSARPLVSIDFDEGDDRDRMRVYAINRDFLLLLLSYTQSLECRELLIKSLSQLFMNHSQYETLQPQTILWLSINLLSKQLISKSLADERSPLVETLYGLFRQVFEILWKHGDLTMAPFYGALLYALDVAYEGEEIQGVILQAYLKGCVAPVKFKGHAYENVVFGDSELAVLLPSSRPEKAWFSTPFLEGLGEASIRVRKHLVRNFCAGFISSVTDNMDDPAPECYI